MEMNEKHKKGTMKVSENVIISITKNAAMEVSGVASIATKPFKITKLISNNVDNSCVEAVMLDGVARISISIIVHNGYNVTSICEQIQERVKAAVQSMTGVPVSKVNVSVVDVDFSNNKN